jgi:predicted phosphoribosyltransferase
VPSGLLYSLGAWLLSGIGRSLEATRRRAAPQPHLVAARKFYRDFRQVTDNKLKEILRREVSEQARPRA